MVFDLTKHDVILLKSFEKKITEYYIDITSEKAA